MSKLSGTRRRTRIVLVVDDDEHCRRGISLVLRVAGYHVHPAHGGREAVAILESGLRPDAITLDLGMPDFDGRQVLERLGSSPELSRIPVIVVSGSLAYDECPEGATAALSKPFIAEQLLALIEACEDTAARSA